MDDGDAIASTFGGWPVRRLVLGAEGVGVAGLRNIEPKRPVPNPRLIERWIGSIGVIETGVGEIGDFGTFASRPDAWAGPVGAAEGASGTTPE